MDIKDLLIELIVNSKKNVKYTIEQLSALVEKRVDSQEDLLDALQELINEGIVVYNEKSGNYSSDITANLYRGILSVKNKNYGFVSNRFGKDYYVESCDFKDAIDKDEVIYRLYQSLDFDSDGNRKWAGVIEKVYKHNREYLVGKLYFEKDKYFLDCVDKNIFTPILVLNNNKIKSKDIVRVKITKYGDLIKSEVVEVLGSDSDIGMDITQIAESYGVARKFSESVKREAKELAVDIEKEKIRRDNYTDKIVFTIDGDDAKDLDDAVSIERLSNGNYLLGVYIADVSYYVNLKGYIDNEAMERGTSVYLVDRVIPMLPFELSNDLCSLNPDEEKLVIACIMEVDKNGDVVDRFIKEGIIKTVKRLTYNKCNDVLHNGLTDNSDYSVVYNSLLLMNELAKILTRKRVRRGSLDFDLPEAKVIVDVNGKAIDVVLRERDISEKIIEEFMILANETVAEFVTDLDLPFIYRVHDKPNYDKLISFKNTINNLGYNLKGFHPKELQKFLSSVKDEDSYLKDKILKMMAKAVYSEENIGHFGLASQNYTHFTSPIRRYPDLLVHRLLRKYIFNCENDLSSEEYVKLKNEIALIAKRSSEAERIASDCEMRVLDMKKCEYIANYVGEIFYGRVTGVFRFGIFVSLDNTIEGLIKQDDLYNHGYVFSQTLELYINNKNGRKISLGNKVKIKVDSANKKINEINFSLVESKGNRTKGGHYGKRKNKNYRKKQKYFS